MNNEKLIRKFDKQANLYGKRKIKRKESMWRESLVRCARGKVLEVGVGAGANFAFYPKDLEVTAVDFSKEMLNKAKEAAVKTGIQAEFIQSDIESLAFPDNSFDTIVSTLTFCGYRDPLTVLTAFNRWCKDDGQILLLEHGISSNRLIGFLQKVIDPIHVHVIGCHLKRDMNQIFQQSGIRIMNTESHIFDAIHLVWAKPNKDQS
ncbi:class I SAM-dependent methyltransferase [Paenibacillus silvisoli]|uniref:class I SAM-dependent methyltransferase n=1 Tax=Paenibacillus silvisoli TaxID=3110539 RepID=UPI00280649E2|nr:class I SAM-dependent methyltransferase [Paenibacillus silvisoli]